jgi:hypothetical protein
VSDHASDLALRVQSQVQSWPEGVRVAHGFHLFSGTKPDLTRRRKSHARTVLVAQTVLDQLGEAADEPMVLMKGLEIAHLYPSLIERPFRDLDLLVQSPTSLWEALVERGYRQNPKRRSDIDHHHLPALEDNTGHIGLEVHSRPNVPPWALISRDLVFSTAEPSRTEVSNVMRPRDDIHALLIALHCWKSGFARLRDLFDALLLAEASILPVSETASELGLGRFWKSTVAIAETELLGRPPRGLGRLNRIVHVRDARTQARRRLRVVAPYLVAGPIRVTRAHVRDFQLGRDARRHPDEAPSLPLN